VSRILVTASLSAALASLVACGGGGSAECTAIYNITKKCEKGFDMPKGTFMAACSAASSDPESKDEVAGMARCAKAKDCEEYEKCQDAARGARRAKDVEKALAEGKLKDAFSDCTYSPEYYSDPAFKAVCTKALGELTSKLTGEDRKSAMNHCRYSSDASKVPEIAAACATLAKADLATAVATLTKARDDGKNDYAACSDVEELTKLAGADVKAAEILCKEAGAAEKAKSGAAEARANAAAKKADIPYECGSGAEELAAIDSPWAKATRTDLLKACYVELGLAIFEAKSGDAKYTCPYEIEQVLEAVTKQGLAAAYPELDAAMKKLPKLCQAAK